MAPPALTPRGRQVIINVGDAVYDLSSFEHPGGELALFGIANSPDPLGLLYQYHEFSPQRLATILAPYCISAKPASVEELARVRQPYERSCELRLRLKTQLGSHIQRLRKWETRFTQSMRYLGWPAFVAFVLATANGDAAVRACAVLLYAVYVHVVLVWNLHGQSHIVTRGADDHIAYCWSCLPFAPHSLAWFMQHTVLHHSFTGVAHNLHEAQASNHVSFDPDVRFSGVLRLSPDEEWLPHHRHQWLYAPLALGLTVWALLIDMVLLATKRQLQLYEDTKVALKGPGEARWLSGLTLGSIGAVVGGVVLGGMPLGCFLMAMTLCSFSVGYVNIPTHTNLVTGHPADGDDYFAAQLAESTSYGGTVSNMLTAGLSKQIEHHIFPNAPFSALPLMTPIVQQYAKEQGVQYNAFSSFGTCLVSWYRQVCYLAREPQPPTSKVEPLCRKAGSIGASTLKENCDKLNLDVPAVESLHEYRKAGAFKAVKHA